MQRIDFDWVNVPLFGMQLIEASAGTGKTWALSKIYLRLLLETPLHPENILVVTFTKAATLELKERLRQGVATTLAMLKQTGPPSDPEDLFIYQRYQGDAYILRKLNSALSHFDQAAIYTIHGFCQRVLMDHALAMGNAIEWTLNHDDQRVFSHLVEDFWQQYIAHTRGLWPQFLYQTGQTPEVWQKEVKTLLGLGRYSTLLLPEVENIVPLESAYQTVYCKAKHLWQAEKEVIAKVLFDSKLGFRKTVLTLIDEAFISEGPSLLKCTKEGTPSLVRVSESELKTLAESKNKTSPSHPFFGLIEQLLAIYRPLWVALVAKKAMSLAQLLQHCERELQTYKASSQELNYDDLLSQVESALSHDDKGRLSLLLRERFGAALIDEFQDTDPIQYRIFTHIYQESACPVFLIGDPKQAIYRFRGADIYTYLNAQQATLAQWTLRTSYRSTNAMLMSLNQLFTRHHNAFFLPEIAYTPVIASACVFAPFSDPLDHAALWCWQLPLGEDKTKPLSKSEAAQWAITATASEIQRLLNEVTIDNQLVKAQDIAVLVPSHHYAAQILHYFDSVGIPAVRSGADSVFASIEAYEWLRVLTAFFIPQDEGARKSALTTIYMGMTANVLWEFSEDELAWEKITLQFLHYHELWQQYGITRAFRTWLSDWQVAPRLIGFANGERHLTNLLHVIELLQHKSQHLTQLALLFDWFKSEVSAPTIDEEVAQLRLESDTARVKVMTVHAAKGLEFPIVFCPFIWHGGRMSSEESILHFHDSAGQNYIDFGSMAYSSHQKIAEEETFAEKLRVLYVALTRAKYRHYLVWGNVKGVEEAPLSWLLYPQAEEGLEVWKQSVKKLDEASRWLAWQQIPDSVILPIPTVAYKSQLIESPPSQPLSLAVWPRANLTLSRMTTSFSGLTEGYYHTIAPLFSAENDAQVESLALTDEMATFPAGARTGLCWHSILEEWDFHSESQLSTLILKNLAAYGFALEWEHPLVKMFEALKAVQIDTKPLSAIRVDQRISELGFTFRLSSVSQVEVAEILDAGGEKRWAEACKNLSFETVQGFMTGFIDLIVEVDQRYFVIDYKSNRVASHYTAYHHQALESVMAEHHYYLQYLIYSVALHRYLRLRLPHYEYEQHFGGIAYIFIRGVVIGTDYGIFRDRPSAELIKALDRLWERNES